MNIKSIIEKFPQLRILVLGDFILDRYVWGDVSRISPEAPVPVVNVRKYEYRLGGAGNVAANLAGLGVKVTSVGVIGNDEEGERLQNLLKQIGSDIFLVPSRKNRRTTTKTRVIAHKQQVVRIDEEDTAEISSGTQELFIQFIMDNIDEYDGVILSDYAKGVVASSLTRKLMEKLKSTGKVIIVDPKGLNYRKYSGATAIKPNFQEFKQAVNRPEIPLDMLEKFAHQLREKLQLSGIAITLGEKGVFIQDPSGNHRLIPTKAKDVFDVSGAGDTFVASFTTSLIISKDWFLSGEIANLASGIVVGKIGTIPININDLKDNLQ